MSENPYQSPQSEINSKSEYAGNMRLTLKSLFKLLFIGFLFGIGPFLVLNGLYALITGNDSVVTFNDTRLAGAKGLIGAIIFSPILAFVLSVFSWVVLSFGLWLYSLIGKLNLEFKE